MSYRFRDKWRFRSKIANFPTPVYFALPLKGFPWNFMDTCAWDHKLEWWGYRAV